MSKGRARFILTTLLVALAYTIARPLVFVLLTELDQPELWMGLFKSRRTGLFARSVVMGEVTIVIVALPLAWTLLRAIPQRAAAAAWIIGLFSLVVFAVGLYIAPIVSPWRLQSWILGLSAVAALPLLTWALQPRSRA